MILVVTATRTEARPLRRRLGGRDGVCVVRAGVGGARLGRSLEGATAVVSCGLAGGLDAALASGALVVPDEVVGEDGVRHRCDEELCARLRAGARRTGLRVHRGSVVGADHIVTGAERQALAGRGHAAVDMESARLAGVARLAVVRVVLDTATRELAEEWSRPGRALLDPRRWREAVWLARAVPLLCDRAARVIAATRWEGGADS